MLASRTLQVGIRCDPARAYAYAAHPENLPRWAAGLCKSVTNSPSGWRVETPHGTMGIRFAEPNALGVLDHYVSVAPGVEVYVPMRVLRNGAGCEVLFTVFREPGMSDEKFAEDLALVEQDLHVLKDLLER